MPGCPDGTITMTLVCSLLPLNSCFTLAFVSPKLTVRSDFEYVSGKPESTTVSSTFPDSPLEGAVDAESLVYASCSKAVSET